MKVLVTGSKGQLGRELTEKLQQNPILSVYDLDVDELDITNLNAVEAVVSRIKPAVIINTAAYTNVDGCETNYPAAYAVNVAGPRNLARAARVIGAKFIHISTDFVFDGLKTTPYFEYDSTNPLSVYGKTKLAGEHAIIQQTSDFFILRTSWLYGKYGNNFVKTMIRLGKTNDSLSVVTDQVGCPTSATDLVEAIIRIMHTEAYGVYHFSNSGSCSWHQFAKEIFNFMGMPVTVNEITARVLNRAAVRPSYSVMDTAMLENAFSLKVSSWQESLQVFIEKNRSLLTAKEEPS